MKVKIVNYEQGIGIDGILTKYAKQMERALIDLGHEVEVVATAGKVKKGDIVHHINYESYIPTGGKDTTMITHIDSDRKLNIVKKSLETSTGICFSKGMKDYLVSKGCPANKLEVVLSAHDELETRPRIIALAYNIYNDGRKNEEFFINLIRHIKDHKKYAFRIMGKGWVPVLDPLLKSGIQVQLVGEFTGDFYHELLNTSDYLLYTGTENAIAQSIIDAKHCLVRVIAPPQEDVEVEYPFKTQKELNKIFDDMIADPVKTWTWENYAKNHLKIWQRK